MRDSALPRMKLPACALAAVSLCLLPAHSHAFLGLFEKKSKVAPGADERQVQEAQATALLMAARDAQNNGKTGRAQSQYKDIVKQYPFTTAAAEAAYASAVLTRADSDVTTAFDAFQKFIARDTAVAVGIKARRDLLLLRFIRAKAGQQFLKILGRHCAGAR